MKLLFLGLACVSLSGCIAGQATPAAGEFQAWRRREDFEFQSWRIAEFIEWQAWLDRRP